MATKPPLPPAPKPVTAVSEKTPPHAPADPLAGSEAGPSAPAAVPSAPPAAPGPLAPLVEPSVSAPAGGVAEPPDLSLAPLLRRPLLSPACLRRPLLRGLEGSPCSWRGWGVSPACDDGGSSAGNVEGGSGGEGGAEPEQFAVRLASPRGSPSGCAPPEPAACCRAPPHIQAPPAPSPAVSAPAPGSRLHLPPVPPVAGVEFVAAGCGSLAAPFALPADAVEPLQFLAEVVQPPQTRVPEATLGQLHRLADSLHALLLIQVLAHSSLPVIPPETFRGRQRDSCLDAADQLAVLLAPVLAAPAEGGAAAAGQLDEAVRGMRRHLRGGSGAVAIGASTLVDPVVAQAVAVQAAAVLAPVGHPWGPPSPGRHSSRPHSPALREERESSRRRRDSPRRSRPQSNWHRGGRGGWGGGRGYGGGPAYVPPVSLADVQRVVSAAIREERAAQRLATAPPAPSPVSVPVAVSPPPVAVAPPPLAPPAPAAVPGHHVIPPWVPPAAPPPQSAAGDAQAFPALGGPPRMAEVPEASLGQLWRLAEGLRAVHLIQAHGHAALSRGGSLDGRQRDELLDAADRLAELLAPVLAAPAMGVIAGVGQLGTAVRGLWRILRVGSGADVIGASTAAVRELHRSLTVLLAVLDADQF
ncbi:unnamed protein product [Closterium sp. Naga37s-1]|nr:unnamed protein product [Closterium sp. Naga37s-1]